MNPILGFLWLGLVAAPADLLQCAALQRPCLPAEESQVFLSELSASVLGLSALFEASSEFVKPSSGAVTGTAAVTAWGDRWGWAEGAFWKLMSSGRDGEVSSGHLKAELPHQQ